MASNSSRVIPDQLNKLLDILGEEGALINGRVHYASDTSKQLFWKNVAQQLNSVDGGVYKNTWKWCKTWSDWKNNTKRKANILLKKKNYGGQYTYKKTALSKLEVRLLKIIGYPLDEISSNMSSEMDDSYKELPKELLNTEYSRLPHKSERFSSEEEDNTTLSSVAKNNVFFSNSGDVLQGGKVEAYPNLSDDEDELLNIKLKEPINKKRKMSLDEYKIKTQYAIQKERSHHKSEELRLKALELKLKGDELKLKETEMNKINYLTNIEEEKLKCFKEISANLKELVERSRNGNNRFHNVM